LGTREADGGHRPLLQWEGIPAAAAASGAGDSAGYLGMRASREDLPALDNRRHRSL
jgi:hypothetical protein